MYRIRINTLALTEKLPTIYAFREYVQAGGLMSYGPNFPDLFRRAGNHVDKIYGEPNQLTSQSSSLLSSI